MQLKDHFLKKIVSNCFYSWETDEKLRKSVSTK